MIKKALFGLIFIASATGYCSEPKALLLDLGGIFFDYSTLAHARNLGISKLIAYMLFNGKNPGKLQESIFEVLAKAEFEKDPTLKSACTKKGIAFPPLLTAFQAGKITSKQALEYATTAFKNHTFSSERQSKLVFRAIELMFNPVKYAQTIQSLSQGISLLQDLARQTDDNGEKRFLLIGFSNWDKESFPLVKERFKEEFKLFDDCCISGEMGTVKPNREIFAQVLRKHNLRADQCLFIDDQDENIKAAQEFGIKEAILFKNYDQIRTVLKERGLLPQEEPTHWALQRPYLLAVCGVCVAFIAYHILSSSHT